MQIADRVIQLQLPAHYFGHRLIGLTGTPDLVAVGEHLTLPTAGPAFHWWYLGEEQA